MEAQELRLKNLVEYPFWNNDGTSKIWMVSDIFWEQDKIGLTDGVIKIKTDFKNIRPIPLTEEWLIYLGFCFINNEKKYGWYLDISTNRLLSWCHSKDISLEFDNDDYNYNNTLFDFNCEYIHQLQNLYFALTGEQLTIKNKTNE